jgi:hypothetical protein
VRDDSDCQRGTLLCAPHAGALLKFEVSQAKLRDCLAEGWSTTPHPLPCWPIRTCPYSIVDESERAGRPKFRLTTDLSWPHEGMISGADGVGVDSVNASMDRSRWPANRLMRGCVSLPRRLPFCLAGRGGGGCGCGRWIAQPSIASWAVSAQSYGVTGCGRRTVCSSIDVAVLVMPLRRRSVRAFQTI